MSREQFLQLPEGPPFYDYVNGEAIEVNRPSVRHQEILLALSASLHGYVQAHTLGKVLIEVNLELPNGNIYTPDILFYTPDTAARLDLSGGYVRGVPDLVVEILSPSTADYDRTQKMARLRGVWRAVGVAGRSGDAASGGVSVDARGVPASAGSGRADAVSPASVS
jgi:Uma2 family endonuclease